MKMLKGHAKLQLFDKSGKMIEEVEHDNMITKALDYVIPALIASNKYPNDYLLPLQYNALGGLMLFDNELEEDPENIHFPNKNTHLVGYAGRYTDASNKQRGSFNSSESSESATGYTMVWDFNTSQANGTIRSLALTHRRGGECPFGFVDTAMRIHELRYSDGYKKILYRDPETQIVYYFLGEDSSNNISPIRSVYVPANIFGVADGAVNPKRYSSVIRTIQYYGITHSYQYNAGSSSNPRWETRTRAIMTGSLYKDGYDGYAYVVWSPGNSTGDGFFYLRRMKIDDASFEEDDQIKITCAGCQLRGPNSNPETGGNSGDSGYGVVSNGFAYFMSYDRHKVYKVDLENTLNIVEVELGDSFTVYDNGRYMVPIRTGGCRVIAQENKGDGNYHAHHFLIGQDGSYTMDQIDRTDSTWYRSYWEAGSQTADLMTIGKEVAGAGAYDCEYLTPNYLGTICNLTSPVIKTAAASLKVIYTLTDEVPPDPEEDGEEEEPADDQNG